MIQKGHKYRYKELCEIMGEKVKSGDSKIAQLKRWQAFFEWEKPSTQTYEVTEVFAIPKVNSNNHGGAREGAGAKQKNQHMFEYLFNSFLMREWQRNSYNDQARWGHAYFTNRQIEEYFGFYNTIFYTATQDKEVDEIVFAKVRNKIAEKRKSWIINKIKRLENVTLTEGIIAYKQDDTFEYKDDFLEEWKMHQSEYLILKGLTLKKVIDDNKWNEMIRYISSYFSRYKKVIKCHKVIFEVKNCTSYDLDKCEEYRLNYNKQIAKEMYKYFMKNESRPYVESMELSKFFDYGEKVECFRFDEEKTMYPYRYIINRYLLLEKQVSSEKHCTYENYELVS